MKEEREITINGDKFVAVGLLPDYRGIYNIHEACEECVFDIYWAGFGRGQHCDKVKCIFHDHLEGNRNIWSRVGGLDGVEEILYPNDCLDCNAGFFEPVSEDSLFNGKWVGVVKNGCKPCVVPRKITGWCSADGDQSVMLDGISMWYPLNVITEINLNVETIFGNGYERCEFGGIVDYISEDRKVVIRNGPNLLNSDNLWRVHVDNEDMDSVGNAEITTVGELQTILRLCGIKDDIFVRKEWLKEERE